MLTDDDFRGMIKFLARCELIHAVMSIAVTIAVLGACWLLDRNHTKLEQLEAQLETRNNQGRAAIELLEQAVERLEQTEQR